MKARVLDGVKSSSVETSFQSSARIRSWNKLSKKTAAADGEDAADREDAADGEDASDNREDAADTGKMH